MQATDTDDRRRHLERIEALLGELQAMPDATARERAVGVIRGVLELHAAGLERMLILLAEAAGEQGPSLLSALTADGLVSSLLLLHGLHPVDVATRVRNALETVRPVMRSHGGDVELLGVDDGVVRLRLTGSCDGCPSSAATLRTSVEAAVLDAAPDAATIVVEAGRAAPHPAPASGHPSLVRLPVISAASGASSR